MAPPQCGDVPCFLRLVLWELLPHSALHCERRLHPLICSIFPAVRAGLVFAAASPGQGPFSALLNTCKTQPRYLTGGGHVCALALCHYFALLMPESPVPARPCLPSPNLGPKCKTGSRVGVSMTLSIVLPWARMIPSPLSGVGWAVLKEEGDQCSNLPGTPPSLTSGPVQWAWGFS